MSYTKEKVLLYHSGNYNCDLCLSEKLCIFFKMPTIPTTSIKDMMQRHTHSHIFLKIKCNQSIFLEGGGIKLKFILDNTNIFIYFY